MAHALFLDRDGVINVDDGYVHRVEQLRFMPGIFEFCRVAAARGFALVIATNQSGIGRGLFAEEDYRVFTAALMARFAAEGVAIAAAYHCPFHPTAGIGPYRRDHPWRKPHPGMLLDAARTLGLDLAGSVMIGDGARDMLAARAAGVGTAIRIAAAGAPGRDAGNPEAIFTTVAETAAWFAARFPPARSAAPR